MQVSDEDFEGVLVGRKIREHLILYNELRVRALQAGEHLVLGWVPWAWTPKHHLLSHLEVQIAMSGSPKNCWCYGDESSIGEAARVAESAHAKTLHRLVIQKRLLSMSRIHNCMSAI